MGIFDQAEFEIRCEWGCEGITRLASISDVIIIVDILSFSTSVEIAVSRGAIIFPYRYKDDSALSYASSIGADLAGNRRDGCKYSLSPKSLSGVSSNQRLVLPSPNGATLSLETRKVPTIAGCLRNASSVAKAAGKLGKRIAVIPAGEKWEETGSLRPCLEDLIGAGAIISALAGHLSPEAKMAVTAFTSTRDHLWKTFSTCSSGKELIAGGFHEDVELACAFDVSTTVPILNGDAYVQFLSDFP